MFTKQYAPELSTIMGPITGFFYSKKILKYTRILYMIYSLQSHWSRDLTRLQNIQMYMSNFTFWFISHTTNNLMFYWASRPVYYYEIPQKRIENIASTNECTNNIHN